MLSRGLDPNKTTAWLGRLFLRLLGWRVAGGLPDLRKYVLIAAPHTSNWDFPLALAMAFALRLKVHWMGKAAMFRWPFAGLLRWLGGIPVERSRASGMVDQSIRAFGERERLVLMVPPEGTRKRVTAWKTGFYHIARGANVPIVMGYLDYRRKVGGIGPVLHPCGEIQSDMDAIRAFYASITGKRRHQFAPAAVAP